MTALVERYAAALFDLDGVVYLGPAAVPGAAEGIAALRDRGVAVGFVTNNASRPPAAVAQHLQELGVAAEDSDIVTSAQAGSRVLADRLPPGATVLVVGTEALADEVRQVGLQPVRGIDPTPAAVIQGYDPNLSFGLLNQAGFAIQRGALWVATNTDSTRPTDEGLVPGNGAAVAVVRTAVAVEPVVAGKPYPPLMDETRRRLNAEPAIFVGDRLDTDIGGAVAVGMDSLLVLSGAHGKVDLVTASPAERPTHVGRDLRALLEPAREVTRTPDQARCAGATASARDGVATLELAAEGDQLDGLRALAALAWAYADRGDPLDVTDALAALSDLP